MRYPLIGYVLLVCLCMMPRLVFAQGRIANTSDSTYVPVDTAQVVNEMKEVEAPRVYRHAFLFTASLATDESNRDDFFLGGAYRFIASPSLDLGFLLSFSARLGEVYTLEQLRPHFFLQREERYRFLVSLSVDKVQDLSGWFGVYAGVGAGYSWGDYEGTGIDPEATWTSVVDVGLSGRFVQNPGRMVVRVGYRYADRVTSDKHAGYIAVGVGL